MVGAVSGNSHSVLRGGGPNNTRTTSSPRIINIIIVVVAIFFFCLSFSVVRTHISVYFDNNNTTCYAHRYVVIAGARFCKRNSMIFFTTSRCSFGLCNVRTICALVWKRLRFTCFLHIPKYTECTWVLPVTIETGTTWFIGQRWTFVLNYVCNIQMCDGRIRRRVRFD